MKPQDMLVCIAIVVGLVVAGFLWPDRSLTIGLVGIGSLVGYAIFRRA